MFSSMYSGIRCYPCWCKFLFGPKAFFYLLNGGCISALFQSLDLPYMVVKLHPSAAIISQSSLEEARPLRRTFSIWTQKKRQWMHQQILVKHNKPALVQLETWKVVWSHCSQKPENGEISEISKKVSLKVPNYFPDGDLPSIQITYCLFQDFLLIA